MQKIKILDGPDYVTTDHKVVSMSYYGFYIIMEHCIWNISHEKIIL